MEKLEELLLIAEGKYKLYKSLSVTRFDNDDGSIFDQIRDEIRKQGVSLQGTKGTFSTDPKSGTVNVHPYGG